MAEKKVWFITRAGRGMAVEIARAVLAAGSAAVATGRNNDSVLKLPQHRDIAADGERTKSIAARS
jgi:NAD(P)-dependent dehydrogenase (short-subunit alcohol dehydrogenase family)